MKTIEFCSKFTSDEMCRAGRDFALSHETMSQVWDACENPSWLFWMLEKCNPLEKEQSVRLSIAFAEMCLVNVPEGEDRPQLAIEAAKTWLDNPCGETQSAAQSAAQSAESAQSAAWAAAQSAQSAAWAAAQSAESAQSAAQSAAWAAAWAAQAAAWAAVRAAQCKMIREMIPNPFL